MDYEQGSWWTREVDYMGKHLTPDQVVEEANRILLLEDEHREISERELAVWEVHS